MYSHECKKLSRNFPWNPPRKAKFKSEAVRKEGGSLPPLREMKELARLTRYLEEPAAAC